MNKGCYYTAQGQFVCHVEKAVAKKEPFLVENPSGAGYREHFQSSVIDEFNPGPEVKVDPRKLPDPPQGSGFTSFKKSCRLMDLDVNGKKLGKCTVTGCVNTAKPPYCMLNCPSCAIDDSQLVNDTWDRANKKVVSRNDYCAKARGDGGGNCTGGNPVKVKMRAEKDSNNKDIYQATDVIVNYGGKLYTLEDARAAKRKDDVAAGRAQAVSGEARS